VSRRRFWRTVREIRRMFGRPLDAARHLLGGRKPAFF